MLVRLDSAVLEYGFLSQPVYIEHLLYAALWGRVERRHEQAVAVRA